MSLATYRKKRHFNRTAEPRGRGVRRKKAGWSFVIQKHDATRLHYDFRLEHDGVLKSWAVPQGPSLDPSQRRLAVEVEDHPLEYGGFEGTIPQGEYGGGSVLLWDRGTWSCDDDVSESLKRGKLKFHLQGEKLQGGWTLVRMRRRPNEKKDNWLLIKERDAEARPLSEANITEDQPASVLCGRAIGEIAGSSDRTWSSKRTKAGLPQKNRKSKPASSRRKASSPKPAGAHRSSFPDEIEPQLATLVDHPPQGDSWVHEIKLDGYRIMAYLQDGNVLLRTRQQNDWTNRFPEIADALSRLPVKSAVLDGEVVGMLPSGVSSFQKVQTALSERKTESLVYFAFDLLYLNGVDLRTVELEQRKQPLQELLSKHPQGRLRYSEHFDGNAAEIVSQCCKLGLEGVVSKRRDGHYVSGRSRDWRKTKCIQREEFVVGGFTDSSASRKSLGALLVGYFNPAGDLVYAGKVGTGFNAVSERDLHERLIARQADGQPFAGRVPDGQKRTTHWVRPELVVQLEYSNWTEGGHLRHGVFMGLREDKPAAEVVLDREQSSKKTSDNKSKLAKSPSKPRKSAARPRRSELSLTAAQKKELAGMRLTHPDKVLYPDVGLTKQDLVTYYAEVAEWMLPYVVDRPLSLVRCPEGEGGKCFYQKHAVAGTPEALHRVMIEEKGKTSPYLVIQSLAGLLSVVQMGVLEIHPWGSTLDDIEKPDQLIFDLDPDPTVTWDRVVKAAKELRDRLQNLGLESFAKASGGKGLHVVVPIQPRHSWDVAKMFTKSIALQLAADSPQDYTANMSKAQRHGRIFIDYLRNDRGATAVAPFSTRSRPGAPVATPLHWKEVNAAIRPDQFTVSNVVAHMRALKELPWQDYFHVRQSLTQKVLREMASR